MRSALVFSASAAMVMAGGGAQAQPSRAGNAEARASEPTTTVTMDSLLAEFRDLPGFAAHFVERKHLAILVEPITTEGDVYYAPPGTLVRTTREPATMLVVRDHALTYRDAAGSQELPLRKDHPARAFVQVFVDLIRGDRAALEAHFVLAFEAGEGEAWSLTMTPRDKQNVAGVQRIELRGTGMVLSRLHIVDVHGDKTESTFSKVDLSRAPTQEIEELLSDGGG